MCFAPKISLTTAIIEFLASGWIYYQYRTNKLANFFISTLILLGLYQFTEHMLCTTENIQLWGKIGFIVYTLIPPNILFFLSRLDRPNKISYLFFLPSFIFITIAILDNNFVIYGTCSTLFVAIMNKFTSYKMSFIPSVLYQEYYFFYIAIATIYLIRRIKKAKTKVEKITSYLVIATSPLIIIPPLILLIFIPSIGIRFSSMYCQFAMLITITALIGLYFEDKINKK